MPTFSEVMRTNTLAVEVFGEQTRQTRLAAECSHCIVARVNVIDDIAVSSQDRRIVVERP